MKMDDDVDILSSEHLQRWFYPFALLGSLSLIFWEPCWCPDPLGGVCAINPYYLINSGHYPNSSHLERFMFHNSCQDDVVPFK
jgi:hypothetical protein